MSTKREQQRRLRIKKRIRGKVAGTTERPRLTVFRSNKQIYVQLIDDSVGHTLVAASSRDEGIATGKPVEVSRAVGQLVAQRAKEAGIVAATFDRNGYRYHGRVQAIAEGAREGGLQI